MSGMTISLPGLGLVFNSGSASGGAAPAVVPLGLIGIGDSRVYLSEGNTGSGGTYSNTMGLAGYPGVMSAVIGNAVLTGAGYNYGVSASSTQALLGNNDTNGRLGSTSFATTGNPASVLTSNSADAKFNEGSDGAYTPLGNPAEAVVLIDEINDPNSGYYTSSLVTMTNLGKVLDQLIAAGKKAIFLGDSHARSGGVFKMLESLTVAAGAATVASPTGFVDGETFGVVGVIGDNGVSNTGVTAFTKVASAPTQGQYTVTSGGLITFGGTPPVHAWANYFTTTGGQAVTQYNLDIYNWANSSSANFNSLGIPGALYNRPQVTSGWLWSGLDDGTGSGLTTKAVKAMDSLDIHPALYATFRTALAWKAKFDALYPAAPSLDRRPTANNFRLGNATAAQTSFSYTLPAAQVTSLGTQVAGARVAKLRFSLSTSSDSITIVDGGGATGSFSGSITVNAVAYTISAGTLNYSTGAITFTSSPGLANTTKVIAELDTTNLLYNGFFDTTANTAALPANWTSPDGTARADGWAFSGDTGTNTAVAAGQMTVAVSKATDKDGYPAIDFLLGGHTGTGTGITINNTNIALLLINAGTDALRGGMTVEILPGADGRLYGLDAWPVKAQVQCSGGVSRARVGTFTTLNGQIADGSTAAVVDDRLLTLLPKFGFHWLSPPVSTAGMNQAGGASPALTSASLVFVINYAAGPISCRVRISAAHLRVRTD